MTTPVFCFDVSRSQKLLSCTVPGIHIPQDSDARIHGGGHSAKPHYRTVQSERLDDIAASAGSLHAAFRSCVERRI